MVIPHNFLQPTETRAPLLSEEFLSNEAPPIMTAAFVAILNTPLARIEIQNEKTPGRAPAQERTVQRHTILDAQDNLDCRMRSGVSNE